MFSLNEREQKRAVDNNDNNLNGMTKVLIKEGQSTKRGHQEGLRLDGR